MAHEALQQVVQHSLHDTLSDSTVHLFGHDNEEIYGGGYRAMPYPDNGHCVFLFDGPSPLIYGYYLSVNGARVYGETFRQPWKAMNLGDACEIDIVVDVKVRGGST